MKVLFFINICLLSNWIGGWHSTTDVPIYIIGSNPQLSLLTHITIDAVFEYPEEASSYSDCNDEPCYTNDSNYPISSWMIETLKEMIIKSNLQIGLSTPTDKSNNANHDVQQNIPS